MQKFKAGDKVRVVDEEKMLEYFVNIDAIRSGTISMVYSDELAVKLSEDEDQWWYPVDCLSLVE